MTTPITLLFGVHAHQPVGNFPEVIDEAHVRCYRKFFEVLEAYPKFRFTAHFSGWLLDVRAAFDGRFLHLAREDGGAASLDLAKREPVRPKAPDAAFSLRQGVLSYRTAAQRWVKNAHFGAPRFGVEASAARNLLRVADIVQRQMKGGALRRSARSRNGGRGAIQAFDDLSHAESFLLEAANLVNMRRCKVGAICHVVSGHGTIRLHGPAFGPNHITENKTGN